MYFPRSGPWAEPNSRGVRFFPRIRPTFARARIRAARTVTQQGPDLAASRAESRPAKERTAYYSAESRPGWLGARLPATRPGAWYLGHAPSKYRGSRGFNSRGRGFSTFPPAARKKRPKIGKTRQNGPKTAPAQPPRPRAPLARPALLVFAGRSVEITRASRVWTRSSASGSSTTNRLDCRLAYTHPYTHSVVKQPNLSESHIAAIDELPSN